MGFSKSNNSIEFFSKIDCSRVSRNGRSYFSGVTPRIAGSADILVLLVRAGFSWAKPLSSKWVDCLYKNFDSYSLVFLIGKGGVDLRFFNKGRGFLVDNGILSFSGGVGCRFPYSGNKSVVYAAVAYLVSCVRDDVDKIIREVSSSKVSSMDLAKRIVPSKGYPVRQGDDLKFVSIGGWLNGVYVKF